MGPAAMSLTVACMLKSSFSMPSLSRSPHKRTEFTAIKSSGQLKMPAPACPSGTRSVSATREKGLSSQFSVTVSVSLTFILVDQLKVRLISAKLFSVVANTAHVFATCQANGIVQIVLIINSRTLND